MIWRLIGMTAAALAAPAAAAETQTVYSVATGNWHVLATPNNCVAFNRPPKEYYATPWNSLTILAPKTGGLLIHVTFWPGSFDAGSRHRLSIRPEPGDPFELDAEPVYDHSLKSVAPVAEHLMAQLETASLVSVQAIGMRASLVFDVTALDDVLSHLDTCRRLLGEG